MLATVAEKAKLRMCAKRRNLELPLTRYEPGKTVTPRPGDFVIGERGEAIEITRVFGRDGVGWRLLDARGRVSTAVPGRRRGLWDSSRAPNPPIEGVCET